MATSPVCDGTCPGWRLARLAPRPGARRRLKHGRVTSGDGAGLSMAPGSPAIGVQRPCALACPGTSGLSRLPNTPHEVCLAGQPCKDGRVPPGRGREKRRIAGAGGPAQSTAECGCEVALGLAGWAARPLPRAADAGFRLAPARPTRDEHHIEEGPGSRMQRRRAPTMPLVACRVEGLVRFRLTRKRHRPLPHPASLSILSLGAGREVARRGSGPAMPFEPKTL